MNPVRFNECISEILDSFIFKAGWLDGWGYLLVKGTNSSGKFRASLKESVWPAECGKGIYTDTCTKHFDVPLCAYQRWGHCPVKATDLYRVENTYIIDSTSKKSTTFSCFSSFLSFVVRSSPAILFSCLKREVINKGRSHVDFIFKLNQILTPN